MFEIIIISSLINWITYAVNYSEKPGPFTGSINSDLIKSSGAKYVIIGHSENRVTGDTNQIINLKIKSALKKKLRIIFCIGETLNERKKNKTNTILNSQIIRGLNKIKKNNNIIFAYEPVWSIGTGIIPKINNLEKQIYNIKKMILKNWKLKNPKIIYVSCIIVFYQIDYLVHDDVEKIAPGSTVPQIHYWENQ